MYLRWRAAKGGGAGKKWVPAPMRDVVEEAIARLTTIGDSGTQNGAVRAREPGPIHAPPRMHDAHRLWRRRRADAITGSRRHRAEIDDDAHMDEVAANLGKVGRQRADHVPRVGRNHSKVLPGADTGRTSTPTEK